MGIGGDGGGYEDEYGRRIDRAEGYGPAARTRTRLPDGEDSEDVYGGARRPPARLGRNVITVVGVVVLLIAAIAFANRDSDASGTATKGNDSHTRPRSTAPTGERPVAGKQQGIATGFARTEQGAQSAAANYAVALGSTDMFARDRRDAVLETVLAPEAVSSFRSTLEQAYTPEFFAELGLEEDGTAPDGFAFISRTTPVGTRVMDYTEDAATVEVWCSGLLGLAGEGSTNPVTDGWFTVTMDLIWTGGDWKVRARTQRSGPAPVNGDTRASGAEEIADAVEQFGGFTYAR